MQALSRWSLGALAVALVILMLAIVAQVIGSALDINPVMTFETALPLIGKAITLNSLLDFQWHLLVIIGLLPAGLVWLDNRHVRVDFLYAGRDKRWQSRVDLAGNLLFAVPFFALMIPAAWDFALRAWRADEGSRNAGLNDLWLIKFVLPFGITLLALAVLVETLRLLRTAR